MKDLWPFGVALRVGGVKPPRAALVEYRRGERPGEKALIRRQVGTEKANASEPLMKCRK